MPSIFNHPDLKDIERQICSATNQIVFFVGAGLSKPLGYPLWSEMFNDVIMFGEAIGRLSPETAAVARQLLKLSHYLECGSLLRSQLGERATDRLRGIFEDKGLSEYGPYDHLVRLPCAGFITTNYDTALEDAYALRWRRSLFPLVLTRPGELTAGVAQRPFLLKLHGDVRTGHFYMSREEYATLEANEVLSRFLYGIYFNSRIVFVGYGLADDDIRAPMRLLTRDFPRAVKRHVAILPNTLCDRDRRTIEDEMSVNVVLYAPDANHTAPHDIIFNWLVALQRARSQEWSFDDPRDCAFMLQRQPDEIGVYLYNIADRALDWLLGLPVRWGGVQGSGLRAANLAQGLIPLEAAKLLLGKDFDCTQFVRDLLTFQDGATGAFRSVTWDQPNIQTHALALYSLAPYREQMRCVSDALPQALEWLETVASLDGNGWGRRPRARYARTVPSLWAFAGMLRNGVFPHERWRRFRSHLLRTGLIDHVLGGHDKSVAAAGTLLWFLSELQESPYWEASDSELIEIAFAHLLPENEDFTNEDEKFPLDDSVESEHPDTPIAWASWIHSTAPAVMTGIVPFLNRGPAAWTILGRAVARLIVQANSGLDGHLKDITTERAAGATYMFHTQYALWGICAYFERVGYRPPGSDLG